MSAFARLAIGALLLAASGAVRAADVAAGGLRVHCAQPVPDRLDCDYSSATGQPASELHAQSAGIALPVGGIAPYPSGGSVSAILILVDTSDPGRQPVIDRNRQQIAAILAAAKPHDRFGLATFDSGLRMSAPIGSAPETINSAADGLRATGMTTELYRSALQAVEALARVQADRRAVVIMSDGQAEDQAYFHEDVIRAALQSGVVIDSIGFPRSVARSVALQSLRRLSAETGGLFIESNMQFDLPADFAAGLIGTVDSGAKFSVDLRPVRGRPDATEAALTFSTPDGPVDVRFPIAIAPAAAAATRAAAGASPAGQPPAPAPVRRGAADTLFWYGVPVALLLLIGLAVVILVLLYRRPAAPGRAAGPAPVDIRPLAYLISQDSRGARYPIRNAVWRIGRSRDNEMTLDDTSVSRRHAEILRAPDGTFTIVDCQSTNGVFVNNEKVERRVIRDGDIIEIGDIVLRFSESPADHPMAENTAMLHTRAPRS